MKQNPNQSIIVSGEKWFSQANYSPQKMRIEFVIKALETFKLWLNINLYFVMY
jgi:hypothetical protein